MSNKISDQAGFIASGVGGIGDLGLGIYNVVQGSKAAKKAKADLEAAMGNRPDLSASSAYADAERNAYSNKMLEMQRQSLQRNLAQGVQAASADPRALAASLTGMTRQAGIGSQEAMMQQAQIRQNATLARAEAEDRSTQLKENRSVADISRESQNLQSARQAIGQGIGQAASGIGNVAGSIYGFNALKAEGGAKVPKTPGAFSHKSNPIDIVKDGAKVGEMTGGEYILNPKQAKDIKRLASSGSKDQLHKYMKSLIKKFEK